MKNTFREILVVIGILGILSVSVYSQPVNPDEQKTDLPVEPANKSNPDAPDGGKKPTGDGASAEPSQEASSLIGNKSQAALPPRILVNPTLQNLINDQLHQTPEDPSFLYETRYIPEHKNEQEFLSPGLEKVVVKERIKEDVDFRKSLGKIKIRLPDLTQTLVLTSIIIIILLYRVRARRHPDMRR
ncbi:MAG: hypothetical protein OEV66_09385 [Spirochaetia bacterium]|nr:hypothetical protein [Spirochaetia bacterium]